jgi:hypothetical protein
VDWTEYDPTEIFFDQDAVQPGETISDQIWIELPDNDEVALQTSLGVAKDENLGWEAKDIVNLLYVRGNITDTSDGDAERG